VRVYEHEHEHVYEHVDEDVSPQRAGGRDAADVRGQSDAGVSARGTRGEDIRADGGGGRERAGPER